MVFFSLIFHRIKSGIETELQFISISSIVSVVWLFILCFDLFPLHLIIWPIYLILTNSTIIIKMHMRIHFQRILFSNIDTWSHIWMWPIYLMPLVFKCIRNCPFVTFFYRLICVFLCCSGRQAAIVILVRLNISSIVGLENQLLEHLFMLEMGALDCCIYVCGLFFYFLFFHPLTSQSRWTNSTHTNTLENGKWPLTKSNRTIVSWCGGGGGGGTFDGNVHPLAV